MATHLAFAKIFAPLSWASSASSISPQFGSCRSTRTPLGRMNSDTRRTPPFGKTAVVGGDVTLQARQRVCGQQMRRLAARGRPESSGIGRQFRFAAVARPGPELIPVALGRCFEDA